MAGVIVPGQRSWGLVRDSEGHREYKLKVLIRCDPTDGPAVAINTPGLPIYGSYWIVDNDIDLWAWCRHDCTVTELVTGEPNTYFELEFTFSTKPPEQRGGQSCKENQVEDPLLEPQKVSGSFVKYQEEATFDRFGRRILTSSFEQIRGPQNEWDATRYTISIEQNVALLNLPLVVSMRDCLNAFTLWGLPARHIKLSGFSWEKKFQGSCSSYYTRHFEFDARPEGFDRDILDEGTKCLQGHWGTDGHWVLDPVAMPLGFPILPDHHNPKDFQRFKDRNGENCRVVLNGAGLPADVTVGTGTSGGPSGEPGNIHVEKYNEANFLLLGIPVTF